jgi:hypothetical protein
MRFCHAVALCVKSPRTFRFRLGRIEYIIAPWPPPVSEPQSDYFAWSVAVPGPHLMPDGTRVM